MIVISQQVIKYEWENKAWYKQQAERWKTLSATWEFFTPEIKSGHIGIGMRNGRTEASFYIWAVGKPEFFHSTLLLICERFNASIQDEIEKEKEYENNGG